MDSSCSCGVTVLLVSLTLKHQFLFIQHTVLYVCFQTLYTRMVQETAHVSTWQHINVVYILVT